MDYKNLEASKMIAQKVHENYEAGKEMYEISDKTKQETVSMKIITLVTLFFPSRHIHLGALVLLTNMLSLD